MLYSYDRTADSRPFYHVTSTAAADAIMKQGFRTDILRTGRDWGAGVYLNPHLEVLDAHWMSHVHDRVTIEVRVKGRLFKLPSSEPTDVYRALYGAEAGNAKYTEDFRAHRLVGMTPKKLWEERFQGLIKERGYVGASAADRQDNTIVFDAANVKPVRILAYDTHDPV